LLIYYNILKAGETDQDFPYLTKYLHIPNQMLFKKYIL